MAFLYKFLYKLYRIFRYCFYNILLLLYKLYRIFRYCFYNILLLLVNIGIAMELLYDAIVVQFLKPFLREFAIYGLGYTFFCVSDVIIFVATPYCLFIGHCLVQLIRWLLWFFEYLCFIYYFVWEVAAFKRHKRKLCFLLYVFLISFLWFLYWGIFIPAWYAGFCKCYAIQGAARCGQMYFCLTLATFCFLELFRALNYFLDEYVTNTKYEAMFWWRE